MSTLKGLSGFSDWWDDEKGMNIGVNEADAWNAYCVVSNSIDIIIAPLI